MFNKLKIEPKNLIKPKKPKTYYTNRGRYQHLKSQMHINNLNKIPQPLKRQLKKEEDYVENKLIELFKGGTLLDEPLEETKLPEPLKPAKYKPTRPVPKPRKKRPLPLPRVKKKRPLQHVSEKVEKIKKLTDEITPFYNPESIREFK